MSFLETLLTGALKAPLLGNMMEKACWRALGICRGAMRRARRDLVRPREWSNKELRRVGDLFEGEVVNVSGWKDEDKTGGHYRDYFPRANAYAVSNFSGARGVSDGDNSIFLDLEGSVPDDLQRRFQVAFNHTTLEHIFDIRRAVANICALSDDAVILVTPFLQAVHYEEGAFGDYWRPTPMCLNRMLEEAGFTVVYQSTNDNPWYIVYVFTLAVRQPERYAGRLPRQPEESGWVGRSHFGMGK